MRFHSKYELREIFPQVHHVGKQLSILINRMIVIIREEIFQSVWDTKAAMFVERECRWRISRSDKHDGTSALIVSKEIINQPFSVSFALGGGTNGYVFYFVNTLSFTRHYRDSLQAVIIEGKHLTSFQIFVYHAFLFICQQQQIQELFLVRNY